MARKLTEKGMLNKIKKLENSVKSLNDLWNQSSKQFKEADENYKKECHKNTRLLVESDRLTREILDYKIKFTHFTDIQEEKDNALKRIKELEGTIVLMAVKNFKESSK